MKRFFSVLLVIALIICALPSCGKVKDFPVTINGVELTAAPQKVVSLSASFTDIICLLQYQQLLVGISENCDSEETETLTRCGTSSNPEVDIIIALGADLVLANGELPYDAVKRLNASGVNVITLEDAVNHSTLKELYINIGSSLGGAVTGAARGEQIVTELLDKIDDIGRTAYGVTEIKNVMYMGDVSGNYIATGDTFLGYILSCCNTNNVADTSTDWSFDKELIAISDPEVIFCKKGIGYELRRSTEFANISAIKTRDVYEIDELWLEKQGATLVSLAQYIVDCTYPEIKQSQSDGGSVQSTEENSGESEAESLAE